MKSYLLTAFAVFNFIIGSHPFPVNDIQGAALYLQKYGYLKEVKGGKTGAILGPNAIANAMKDFQRFVGLKVTGKLDNDTVVMMNTPRCGVKDIIDLPKSARNKRYAHEGSKWRVHLTYRISKYPNKVKNKTKIDGEMARAFKVWSDKTMFSFEEKKRGRVHIDIRFETGAHGDDDPFDGPGETLAHAFFPRYGGDVHFDDDEEWTYYGKTGINLFQVAAHEFGHSLGLLHSSKKHALMAPYYDGYQPSFKLHMDDIRGIQSLYGSSDQLSSEKDEEATDSPSDPNDPPDLCHDAKFDTITRIERGNTYVFKGNFYWRLLSDGGIAEGYPRRIADDWDGLEGNLGASLTWFDGKTYFFKGERYWRFTGKRMDNGYPKLLSVGFELIPENIDAAIVWNGNGKPYFFKGEKYWRFDRSYDPPVNYKYPSPINLWKGLPNNIDAAIRWDNNKTYFFKDDEYYRFNDISSEVDSEPRYPLPTSAHWFGCKSYH